MGWKMVKESAPLQAKKNTNVVWVDTSEGFRTLFHFIQPWQCVNHFPGMTNIARKIRLAQNLEFMKKRFYKDFSFFPRTYVLPRDFLAFKKCFGSKGISKTTYIVKPDGGAQGRGIFLTRKIDDIDKGSPCVAQSYIKNPLLIENKKFDLRVYVLITSCHPLRIYLFRDGLVRLCTEDFVKPNSKNLNDRCMHLTNYSINRHSNKFDRGDTFIDNDEWGSTGSKRSIKWLLNSLRAKNGGSKIDKLWSTIGDICTKTIMSILPILVREYSSTFCMDDMFKKRQKEILAMNNSNYEIHSNTENVNDCTNNIPSIHTSEGQNFLHPKTKKTPPANRIEAINSSNETENKSTSQQSIKDDNIDSAKIMKNNEVHIELDEQKEKDDNISMNGEKSHNVPNSSSNQAELIEGSRCIQVLGFDILIDDKLKPYLIEVNHLPSFETDSELDKEIKSKVIAQAISIIKARPQDRRKYEKRKRRECKERLYNKIHFKKLNGGEFDGESSGHKHDCISSESKRRHSCSGKIHNTTYNHDDSDKCENVKLIENQIRAVYSHYMPHKIDKIPSLLLKHKGNESWLLNQIANKYKHSKNSDGEYFDCNHIFNSDTRLLVENKIAQKTHEGDIEEKSSQNSFHMNDNSLLIKQEIEKMSLEDISVNSCIQNLTTPIRDFKQKGEEQSAEAVIPNLNDKFGDEEISEAENDDDIFNKYNTSESSQCMSYQVKLFQEEEDALIDYDRIFPFRHGERKRNQRVYAEMEKYIYKEDLKQQMRMTCPLQQSRSVDESEFETENRTEHVSYSFIRSDSWINGNIYSRKPVINPFKPLPVPSTKQIEAADRLSRGFSVSMCNSLKKKYDDRNKNYSTNKNIGLSLGGSSGDMVNMDVNGELGIDGTWIGSSNSYPSGTKKHIRRMNESKNTTFTQRRSNGVLVRPVNFDFGISGANRVDDQFLLPFGGRHDFFNNHNAHDVGTNISFMNFVSSAELHGRTIRRE